MNFYPYGMLFVAAFGISQASEVPTKKVITEFPKSGLQLVEIDGKDQVIEGDFVEECHQIAQDIGGYYLAKKITYEQKLSLLPSSSNSFLDVLARSSMENRVQKYEKYSLAFTLLNDAMQEVLKSLIKKRDFTKESQCVSFAMSENSRVSVTTQNITYYQHLKVIAHIIEPWRYENFLRNATDLILPEEGVFAVLIESIEEVIDLKSTDKGILAKRMQEKTSAKLEKKYSTVYKPLEDFRKLITQTLLNFREDLNDLSLGDKDNIMMYD